MRIWLGVCCLLPGILAGRVTHDQIPVLASDAGFNGVDWLDRVLPSLERRDLAELGRRCADQGLGPGGLNLTQAFAGPRAIIREHTRRNLALLDCCPDLGVEMVRVALSGGKPSLALGLEVLSMTCPSGFRKRRVLGLAGRQAYRLAAALGLADDRGGGRAVAPPRAEAWQIEAAVSALRPLAKRAQELGLELGLENHWGITSNFEDILLIINKLNYKNMGTCLDLGNFYANQDPTKMVERLASQTLHVHYKLRQPDAHKEAMQHNYAELLTILHNQNPGLGFSIEYEGPEPRLKGAIAAANELQRLWPVKNS